MSFFMEDLTAKLTTRTIRWTALPLLVSAALLGGCSETATNPDVTARQDMMKNWGDAMGVMGDMMKAPDTFDPEVFKEQAAFLAEDSQNPWPHFDDETAVGHATESVWSDAEGFRAEAEKLQQATAKLNLAAQTATSVEDVQEEFKAVGGTCKSCHTDYKVKDE